ncbi:hypothetical protein [Conexibacter woesei]|nr:hypothetical protein [Conexibacter woesei]
MERRQSHQIAATALVAALLAVWVPTVVAAELTSKPSLQRCVERIGLMFGSEGEAPPSGDPRLGLEIPGATYAGFVVWPSDHVADVYLGRSVPAAKRAARRYERFLQRLGAGDIPVTRFGNVVVAGDDDGPPTAREVRTLRRCA